MRKRRNVFNWRKISFRRNPILMQNVSGHAIKITGCMGSPYFFAFVDAARDSIDRFVCKVFGPQTTPALEEFHKPAPDAFILLACLLPVFVETV
jgi:hypothetical protein